MRILCLSRIDGTSGHRIAALRRLGHEVIVRDPYQAYSHYLKNRWTGAANYRTGYALLQGSMQRWTTSVVQTAPEIDLVWIDHGELFGPKVVNSLRLLGKPVILYNVDDPTGTRDGHRFDSLRRALPHYDLCVVVRKENVAEFGSQGAVRVLRVWRSYDEVAHNPARAPRPVPARFCADVSFIGTWMRNEARDAFLLSLAERGLDIGIWGDRWQKSSLWLRLRPYWRGPSLDGADYLAAIQGAKVCLGLLSKGNRDLHTQRSLEIPYAGGLLCAQRTSEHLELYVEGEEAVFWSDANECAEKCLELLADSEKRSRIRVAGMRRVRQNGVGNEDICRQVLAAVAGWEGGAGEPLRPSV